MPNDRKLSGFDFGFAEARLFASAYYSAAEHAQLLAYVNAAGINSATVIDYETTRFIDYGGVVIHDETTIFSDEVGDAKLLDIDGGLQWIDYKLSVNLMREIGIDRALTLAVDTAMKKDDGDPKIKPTRAPKRRDWEQRNKKRRHK